MEVIPLDGNLVKGSHGRVTDDPADGPVFISTEPKLLDADTLPAESVHDRILDHVFED